MEINAKTANIVDITKQEVVGAIETLELWSDM